MERYWNVGKLEYWNNDNLVKSRHSRENGNPGNSKPSKTLDSCLRRNDKNFFFGLFTRPSIMGNEKVEAEF
jgi:hypothetical protein